MNLEHDIHERVIVAAPGGAAITTRLRLSEQDERVLRELMGHVSRLRRVDLARACSLPTVGSDLAEAERRQIARDRLNARKRSLTEQSSSRWASSIIRHNDAQRALSRRGLVNERRSKKRAITAIRTRMALPTRDREPHGYVRPTRRTRAKGAPAGGYRNQRERHAKGLRLIALEARVREIDAILASGRLSIVDGGHRLLTNRHNLEAAGLTPEQWRATWDAKRSWIKANGGSDEPFGNLTISVRPDGQVSIRLPRPLEHLANAPRGRYILACPVVFKHRGDEWADHVLSDRPATAYTIATKPGKRGLYLTASWSCSEPETPTVPIGGGRTLGVDMNADHLAGWVLDASGNPLGQPITIELDLAGSAGQRDANLRQGLRRLIHLAQRRGVRTIVVEDLGFDDARDTGRETMGAGTRGKTFRRTVAGMPTAKLRGHLTAMTHRAGIQLIAVNPAYTSKWGVQHWRKPLDERTPDHTRVSGHHSAAVVIGRRGHAQKARRRAGGIAGDQRIAGRTTTTQTGHECVSAATDPQVNPIRTLEPDRSPGRKSRACRATVTPADVSSCRHHL